MTQAGDVWTLRKVLDWTTGFFQRKNVESSRLCAEMILAHVLGVQRIRLYTDLYRVLTDAQLARVRELVKRASDSEPIQYLTNKAHFFSLEFYVDSNVLIPRPDTETLVERALTFFKSENIIAPRVLDLCTGSGCVAAAIASNSKSAVVFATDISLPALDVARRNIAALKLESRVSCHLGDLYDAMKTVMDAGPMDAIVSNPPYIASEKIESLDRNVRDFEPHLALDGGPDGLDPHRKILAGAKDHLREGGRVFLEIAYDQEEPAMWMLSQADHFDDARCYRDLAGKPRVISARKK
jgi:release factor glutamine methyltransferase